ncbi:MAG: hypothetical protein AAF192_00265 [Pseudomonadota bacterium]
MREIYLEWRERYIYRPVMVEREDILLELSSRFGAFKAVGPSRVGALVGCDGNFFKDIAGRDDRPPRSVRRATFERVVQEFSDIWPAALEWPADIPRPTPTKREAA